MNSNYKTLCMLCFQLAALSVFQYAFADEAINTVGTHGYFRLGTGISKDDAAQEVFKAPGAGAKYRLGNENDNYIEADLYDDYKLQGGIANSPAIHSEGMVVLAGTPYEDITFQNVSQLFMEASNFITAMGNPKLWVGRRYYDRHDIHINDYFFLNTLQGYDGGGISDIAAGPGKLALAFGRANITEPGVAAGTTTTFTQTNIDVRFTDVPVNPNGTIMLWGLYSENSNDQAGMQGMRGEAVGIMHIQKELLGGSNKFMVQYGHGLARNAGQAGVEGVTTAENPDGMKDARTWRVTDSLVLEPLSNFSIMTAFVYEDKKSVKFDGTDQVWISLGARPVYFVNDHFRVPFELGYDHVDNRTTNLNSWLVKTTLAAELALKRGFWERPVLRAYVTHADWSDTAKGTVGGTTYASATNGYSYGIQIETWW